MCAFWINSFVVIVIPPYWLFTNCCISPYTCSRSRLIWFSFASMCIRRLFCTFKVFSSASNCQIRFCCSFSTVSDCWFAVVFSHLQYKPDDPVNEELRRPKRAWADRVTGVDCDCYSIFIGSILSNLNIPFALRMVKINNKPYFQHVYVVVPKSGKRNELESRSSYFVVDPVLDTFNEEHPFTGNRITSYNVCYTKLLRFNKK